MICAWLHARLRFASGGGMSFQPNLAGLQRLAYVAAGIGLMAWGTFGDLSPVLHIAVPVAGALVLLEGLIAF